MAKFKVGDKVKLPDGKVGVVKKVTSFGGVSDNIIEVPGMSLTSRRDDELTIANSASTNPVVQNALAARNGQHFHGGGDALAEKIARAVQKYADANGGAKGKYLDEITTLSRTASSLAGGAWVMRDGSVALTDKQPRGATRLMDFVKTLNSAVAANAEDAGILGALRKAKSDIGSALGKFNSHEHGDVKWAQKVNRACDDVARAINNAVRALGS